MMANEVGDRTARLAVWQAYLQIHSTMIRLLEEHLEQEEGLPLLWYNALTCLSQAPDHTLRLQELAEAIHMSQSGLTRLLDRMVEMGLIERRPCPQDRRGLYAALTPIGLAKLADAQPVYQRVLEGHFLRYLSCDEVAALNKVFNHIVASEGAQDRYVESTSH
jgi:DNA-binding MarR family transcriptional regulator